ncbi:PAS domain S-box protein [Halarcobacter sp.]|uniref:PAS domain S-box protein n=1 Tax=Halarcobacter sp. TaxID=2321133 RepID=UPI0029F51863|nr:PAS domain S-box protein [Halarcobacter sp.]
MGDKHYLKAELDEYIKNDVSIFDFIQSASLDGIWYWDLENPKNQWMSDKFWKVLGYDPNKKKNLSSEWQELVNEEDLKLAIDNFNKHLENPNHPYDQILRYKHANGSTAWIRCRGMAIRDKNGKPYRMVGAHNDMTIVMDGLKKLEKYNGLSRLNENLTQKYNEEHQQRLEIEKVNKDIERYINLIDKFIISSTIDLKGNIVNVSDAYCKISGYTKDELIGESYIKNVFPNSETPKIEELQKLTKESDTWEGERKNLRKDGTTYWLKSTITPIIDDTENVIGYSTLNVDITDKNIVKQNNLELKTIKETLDNAVKIAKLGTWEWNLTHDIMKFSKISYEIFGLEEGILIDFESFKNFVVKDDKKRYKRIINKALKKKSSFSFEYRIYRGFEIRKVWVIGNPIIENRKVVRFTGILQDITELKKVEEELEEAQKIAKIGHYNYNIKDDIFTNSYIIDEIFGFDEKIIKHFRVWSNLIHKDDKERVKKYFDGIYKENKKFDTEYRIINKKTNSIRWVHMLGELSFDREGNVISFFGTIQDITSRKELESDLLQAHNVFENTHDGILVTDDEGKILNVNKSFETITGYKLEEVIGLDPSVLKSGVHDDDFYKDLWREVRTNGYWSGEIHNKTKSGNIYQELLTVNAIYDESGHICNYIGLFSDITKQKKQDKLILQQSRTAAIGEMLENIAHQWRQPLSIISTSATGLKFLLEMDKEDKIPKEKVLTVLDDVNNYAQYLSNTIEDFRSFFKGDMTKIKRFNIRETLEKITNLTKDSFMHNFIELVDDSQAKDIFIENNENILTQALINIYNNAKDALAEYVKHKDKRYFFISLEETGNTLYLHFKDNAGGISTNIMNQIFDPYFTTKHESIGTGLGLYMTYQIVTKQLKGTIEVHNVTYEYEGKIYKGAEFIIGIPVTKTN